MDDNGKRDKYMDLAIEALKSSSLIVSNYSEGEERERQLNKLLKLMENYCELDIHFENSKKAIRKAEKLVKKRAEEGEDIDDISFYKIYTEVMDKMKESAPDAKETINFKVFKEHIERLQPKEAADVQDDVEMSQFSLNPIDPITKRTMVNPVRSSQCGHTFGKEGIESLLKLKTSTRCPIPGCPHKITKKDLEPDLQMQQFLQKMARNQQQPQLISHV